MDEQPGSSSRESEVFKMGALAVDHSDATESSAASESNNHAVSKIGHIATQGPDEKLIEPDEQIVKVIHRHPIGVIGIYAEMITGIALVIIGVTFALNGTFGNLPSGAKGLLLALAILFSAFLATILLISAGVYRRSRVIITDKSLVSIVQKAVFSRKVSRLSMTNVEDVTAEQKGILQTMLNYGTLTIQTAGEEDNFIFPYCPKPNDAADQILEIRQANVRNSD